MSNLTEDEWTYVSNSRANANWGLLTQKFFMDQNLVTIPMQTTKAELAFWLWCQDQRIIMDYVSHDPNEKIETWNIPDLKQRTIFKMKFG
jgi:hypothetical protein